MIGELPPLKFLADSCYVSDHRLLRPLVNHKAYKFQVTVFAFSLEVRTLQNPRVSTRNRHPRETAWPSDPIMANKMPGSLDFSIPERRVPLNTLIKQCHMSARALVAGPIKTV